MIIAIISAPVVDYNHIAAVEAIEYNVLSCFRMEIAIIWSV
jgi:hypothetical protein